MINRADDLGQKLFCLCDFPWYFSVPYCVLGGCREEVGIPSFCTRSMWC